MPTCVLNKKILTGFVNIGVILDEHLQKKDSFLCENTPEEKAEVRQWLEYCLTVSQSKNINNLTMLKVNF